jgi:putative ATP-binding cassette transporter
MKLFDAFSDKSPNLIFFSIILGALGGIAYGMLIPLVLDSLTDSSNGLRYVDSGVQTVLSFEVVNFKKAELFFYTCLFVLFARVLSQVILTRVSLEVTTALRVKLYNRIMKAPLEAVEKVGTPRLIAGLITDVDRVIDGARTFPLILVNVATLIGMLGFLFFLKPEVFYFVMKSIAVGIIVYQALLFVGNRYFIKSRDKIDLLHESIRALIHGVKELKVNKQNQENFFKHYLLENEYAVLNASRTGYTVISVAINYGGLISFFIIGFISFVYINYQAISATEIISVIMVLLYISTPLAAIMDFTHEIMTARISLKKLDALLDDLPEEEASDEIRPLPAWDKVTFKDVGFQYSSTNNNHFSVGPVSFEVEKSQLTFIVGGNGSGKSTLGKIISLHYGAKQGEIYFGQTLVTAETLNSCRQLVEAIYSDYYLFDRLLGEVDQKSEQKIKALLEELSLSEKVAINNGRFSTTALSDGQRRRLSLLVAFLTDRELYLFDEWAADQDPEFKEVFYYKILPDLKAQGKAVIVISHDDRYFPVADKILVMENGVLLETRYSEQQSAQRVAKSV